MDGTAALQQCTMIGYDRRRFRSLNVFQINLRDCYKTYFPVDPIPSEREQAEVLEPVQRLRGNRIISNFSPWRSGFPVALFPRIRFPRVSLMPSAYATFRNRRRSRNIFFSPSFFPSGLFSSFFLFSFYVRGGNIPRCFARAYIAHRRCGFASSKYNSSRVARVYCARINTTRQTIRANERHELATVSGTGNNPRCAYPRTSESLVYPPKS